MPMTAFVSQGDKFNPKDNSNKPLIVRLVAVKHGVKTKFTEKATKLKRDAEGKPMLDQFGDKVYEADMEVRENGQDALIVDIVDLSTNRVYTNVQWMAGTIVDRLSTSMKPGEINVMRLDNSRGYIVPAGGTAADVDLANAYEAKVGEENIFSKGLPARTATLAVPTQRTAPDVESDEDDDELA